LILEEIVQKKYIKAMKKTGSVKIMVIEDEELLLQAINIKLSNLGFETVSCTSAEQAYDYLENMPELPDAIWLDYYLGDMSGLDFMKMLKKNEKLNKIPVFVVSNSASEDKKKSLLDLGVVEYILKAENRLEDIAKMIKSHVEKN
jgi:CheY-like chemotaxis protein